MWRASAQGVGGDEKMKEKYYFITFKLPAPPSLANRSKSLGRGTSEPRKFPMTVYISSIRRESTLGAALRLPASTTLRRPLAPGAHQRKIEPQANRLGTQSFCQCGIAL